MVEATKELKKKKKLWIKIIAPKEYRSKQIGETIVKEPKAAINRVIETSLALLTNDPRKQYVRLYLKINDVKGEQADTEVIRYKVLDTHLRRLVKAGKEKLMDSFKAKAKDKNVVIKLFILAKSKISNAMCAALRNEARKYFENYLKDKTSLMFVNDLVSGNVQKMLKITLKKIYPVSVCEVSTMEILK